MLRADVFLCQLTCPEEAERGAGFKLGLVHVRAGGDLQGLGFGVPMRSRRQRTWPVPL